MPEDKIKIMTCTDPNMSARGTSAYHDALMTEVATSLRAKIEKEVRVAKFRMELEKILEVDDET
jgi:hypothetical protein